MGFIYFSVSTLSDESSSMSERLLKRIFKKEKNTHINNAEKVTHIKGDYWIKQRFSIIASLCKIETSLNGKNSLPEGANYCLYEQFLRIWKSLLPYKLPPLDVTFFTHVRRLCIGSYSNDKYH